MAARAVVDMTRDLPVGTVTFLFTDVEGSTRLLDELGAEGYAAELGRHRGILRDAFIRHGGVEVGTDGDAFFVAFTTAPGAAAAVQDALASMAGGRIRVRAGIHTGTPLVADDDYVGMDVHRAARIAACGHGGQVVLSETARRLLPDDLPLRDLGEHRLKDMVAAQRLYQLGEEDFPPLKTLDATNLPVAASPLVGRQREVDEIVSLLSSGTRLLTVTGPGGTGKTRLGLQVAAELAAGFRDGVFWVPLPGLSDPELVSSELGQTVGARDDLVGFLRGKELLIMLDNFEHLLDAAPATSALLSATGGLHLLVTSRSPLHVSGEREYRLEPLSSSDAALLFVERASAFGRELVRDSTIEAICLRLDGLPLAVELAAARTKLLTPEVLLQRLDVSLPLLTGGARDAPERQRTLRATIAWSYDLLEPAAQELFERLSIFAGSYSLAAAEEICDADLDGLATLVDSSLLKPIGDDRFLMLETIREYARERIEDSIDTAALRLRHAAYFCALGEQGYARRFDAEAEWAKRLEIDHDDLRAAVDWLAVSDPNRALELAGALGWFWLTHGYHVEGRQRLTDALARSPAAETRRARAFAAAGALTARCGQVDEGRALLIEAIDLWRSLDDRAELATALDAFGWLLVYDAGDAAGALDAFEQSLDLRRQQNDRLGETRALVGVCQSLVALGNVERAQSLSHELLLAADGDPRTLHFAYAFLGDCALIRGDFDEAERHYLESLRAGLPLRDVIETSAAIQGVAMASAGIGDPHRALRLAAAVEALFESFGIWSSTPFWDELLAKHIGAAPGDPPFWNELLEEHIVSAREALGDQAAAVWAEGRTMTLEDAVVLALTPRAP
jgi:predicted ATPase/class 3 adenylate cyclase